jgi:hypothetical protein
MVSIFDVHERGLKTDLEMGIVPCQVYISCTRQAFLLGESQANNVVRIPGPAAL